LRLAFGLAALMLLAGPAAADSIIEPFSETSPLNPLSSTSEIANYLAANYGIFIDFTDTSPANLELIDTWYSLLFPGFVYSGSEGSGGDQTPSIVPEPGTLGLLGASLAAFIIGFHVSLRRSCQPSSNRLHPEKQRARAGPAGTPA